MPKCAICKEDKSDNEMDNDICIDCAFAIIRENDKDLGMDNFS